MTEAQYHIGYDVQCVFSICCIIIVAPVLQFCIKIIYSCLIIKEYHIHSVGIRLCGKKRELHFICDSD